MTNFTVLRTNMVYNQIIARGIKDQHVIDAMLKIPRHIFVDNEFKNESYEDYPLPIGENQTISQPYIIALMTEALELHGSERVLEVGTGCGYQTAILSELAKEVYTVERIEKLSLKARRIISELGYLNVHYKIGNGILGWKEFAPYQAIIVTAAAKEIPKTYIEQLDIEGRLVLPVESVFSQYQTLYKIIKLENGTIKKYSLGGCRFVPLIGEY